MADPGTRRHHPEAVERLLRPAQELVALEVALVLDAHVLLEGGRHPGAFGDDGVVDHELHRDQRVDAAGSPPSPTMASRMAARSTTAGTPVKSCISTPLGGEGDLPGVVAGVGAVGLGVASPCRHRRHVGRRHPQPVLVAQEVLEQHLDAVGQAGHVVAGGQRLGAEAEDLERPVTHRELGPGTGSCRDAESRFVPCCHSARRALRHLSGGASAPSPGRLREASAAGTLDAAGWSTTRRSQPGHDRHHGPSAPGREGPSPSRRRSCLARTRWPLPPARCGRQFAPVAGAASSSPPVPQGRCGRRS